MTKITDENDNLMDISPVLTEGNMKGSESVSEVATDTVQPIAPPPVPRAPEVPQVLTPEMIAFLKKEIMQEMKSEKEILRQQIIEDREEAKKLQDIYVEKMKESSEPWVDIQGWVQTEQGVRIELDWNNAFVAHLKQEGIKGADDDQVVQHWVTLLLRDMDAQLSEGMPEQSEYE